MNFFATGSGVVALVFSILGLAFLTVGAGFAFVLLANEATDWSTATGEPRWVLAVTFLSIGAGFAAVGLTLCGDASRHFAEVRRFGSTGCRRPVRSHQWNKTSAYG